MKNSKEYTKKISALYQSLKRKGYKFPELEVKSVVDSLIYGIISEKLTEKETEAAIKRFDDYFVDFNDLRVSRLEEIAELLGEDNSQNRQIALTITKVLNSIYNESHNVSLEGIQKLGKRPARQKFEKMEELSLFSIDYCMLTALDSHTIPLTETMLEYLRSNKLIDEGADAKEAEGFLAKQISAKNGYEFYKLLRHESETTISRASSVKSVTSDKSRKSHTNKEKAAKTVKKAKTDSTDEIKKETISPVKKAKIVKKVKKATTTSKTKRKK
ncbi:MAG: hypothetical protein JXA96_07830 [Sedimentisphaerales bacterium]|nr:hypothetical protein [Sedimentisphaerales bacterium]